MAIQFDIKKLKNINEMLLLEPPSQRRGKSPHSPL